MFNIRDLQPIKIPYWNIDDYFDKVRLEVVGNFRSSYKNLLNGRTFCWDCDLFWDKACGDIRRGEIEKYYKHYYLTLGYSLHTNLNEEAEKELFKSNDFYHRVWELKEVLVNEFNGIVNGIDVGFSQNIFYVHLTVEKSRDILLSPIGKNFDFDEYIVNHPNELYLYKNG